MPVEFEVKGNWLADKEISVNIEDTEALGLGFYKESVLNEDTGSNEIEYSYGFLDNLIENNLLNIGIDTIYEQVDEEKLWQLYLSIPMKEKSYNDWKEEVIANSNNENDEDDIEAARDRARDILKNFKP